MAEEHITEAADYMKNVLDNMVADLKEKRDEAQAEAEAALDDYVETLKDTADEAFGDAERALDDAMEELEDAMDGDDDTDGPTPVALYQQWDWCDESGCNMIRSSDTQWWISYE